MILRAGIWQHGSVYQNDFVGLKLAIEHSVLYGQPTKNVIKIQFLYHHRKLLFLLYPFPDMQMQALELKLFLRFY